jgi:hypothetical protein
MDDADLGLRNLTYALFVELGRSPSADEVTERAGASREDVLAVWRRLDEQHAIVLDAGGESLRMANPFSAVPTPHRVVADGRTWYANCAWDAFGVCAALGVDGRIETTCPDCGDTIVLGVSEGRPDDESLLFHSLVPASGWWDDIVFT